MVVQGQQGSRSMWTARKEKKTAGRRHASNFNAGYVEVEEYHLHRTGIRGRKRWFVWCGAAILLAIVLANLLVSSVHMYIIQLTDISLCFNLRKI